ncbi:hypothetical protein [Maridesulfovibrio ferrireducens]|uniref:hypothetical protein n=1 Tax=Maridesulfovibrio ferrireducens TaxID=246191 RepID=UPI001A32EBDC|nr:hypothetical protein [Maridesulfovibrio ferrireducens]MBI9111952.1 hypothetical protein [Maridesulfovibrio ferrireducens]
MRDLSLKQVDFGEFTIRYFVIENVPYFCPEDINAVMATASEEVADDEDVVWDKVEVGRRIFSNDLFFEWFAVQFERFDYAEDIVIPDPLPW